MRMIRNNTGNPARVAVCLTASMPEISPPVPAVTVRIARRPINPPQKIFTIAGGSGFLRSLPVVVSDDIVVVNESARVVNEMKIAINMRMPKKRDGGSSSKQANNDSGTPPSPLMMSQSLPLPSQSKYIADPPNTQNQKAPNAAGRRRLTVTNSRIVRPYDTRAMNIPIKGALAPQSAHSKIGQSRGQDSPSIGLNHRCISAKSDRYFPVP